MKKQLLLLLLITSVTISLMSSISAQSIRSIPSLEDYVSVGYSVGPGQGFSLAIDKLVSEVGKGCIGIGGVINGRTKTLKQGDQLYGLIAGKLSYHHYLPAIPRLDLYGHVALGYGLEEVNNDNWYTGPRQESEETYTAWGLAVGSRYRLIWGLSVYAEVGYGMGYANAGITWNL